MTIETPVGNLTLAEEDGFLTNIFFANEAPAVIPLSYSFFLEKAAAQIFEYFDGKRTEFDLPLKPSGGQFHKKVWDIMLEKVRFGATITYGELASLAGNPKAARAVGSANNKNPIPIIIPCHRVLGKTGRLTGFRGGLDMKQQLLTHENQKFST